MTIQRLHEDEVHIDVELVRRLLSAQFDHWSQRTLSFVSSSGTVNVIYRLGDDLCVRLPRLPQYSADLEKELEWLPALAPELSLETPEPVARGEPSPDYPFTWAIYGWLQGITVDPQRAKEIPRIHEPLAQFVAELRQIDVSGAPRSRRDFSMKVRDVSAGEAIESLGENVDADAVTSAWEAALEAPEWDGIPVWTHGDLLPPNLLVKADRLSAAIDFGNMGDGDPAVDVVAAWSVLDDEGRTLFRSILDVDDATWDRARGFALHQALLIIPYYRETHPDFVAMAIRTVEEILNDSNHYPRAGA